MKSVHIACPHCGFSKDVPGDKIPQGLKHITCPKCRKGFPFQGRVAATDSATDLSRAETDVAPAGVKFCSTCGKRLNLKAEICPGCGVRVAPPANAVNKIVLLLVTFFLGGLGGHKFYLKKYLQGVLYLLFFWTYIPTLASLVEFIIYAVKSEPELQRRYPATAGSGILVFVVAVPMFFAVIGILAAIAIPQFAAYRQRASNAMANNDLKNCRSQIEAYAASNHIYPTVVGQIECSVSKNVSLYYLSFGAEEFQLVSFHEQGSKAYLSDSSTLEIAEFGLEEVQQEIIQKYGSVAPSNDFHFVESSQAL